MSDPYKLKPRYNRDIILKKGISVNRRLRGPRGLYLKMKKLMLGTYMFIPEGWRDTIEKGDYSDLIKLGMVDFVADKFSHAFESKDNESGFRESLRFPVQPPHIHGPAHPHGGHGHER